MRRYNFDTIPPKASGYGVHAESKRKAYELALQLVVHAGPLKFRDNMKCPKGYCTICWPDEMEVVELNARNAGTKSKKAND